MKLNFRSVLSLLFCFIFTLVAQQAFSQTNYPSSTFNNLNVLGSLVAAGGTLTNTTLASPTLTGTPSNTGAFTTTNGELLYGNSSYTAGASMPVMLGAGPGTTVTLTGTLSSSAPVFIADPFVSPFSLAITTDHISNNAGPPISFVNILGQYGGVSSQSGGRSGLSVVLNQLSNVSGTTGDTGLVDFVSGNFWVTQHTNVGGTGVGAGNSNGMVFGANFKAILTGQNNGQAGSTYYSLLNALGEADASVQATQQPFTFGGTGTSGDATILTFVSTDIPGGTLPISYSPGNSQTPQSMANNMEAKINANTTLASLGISATTLGSGGNLIPTVTVAWPLWRATLTITPSVTGSATETITSGSITTGASSDVIFGESIIHLNSHGSPAYVFSSAINISDQPSWIGGGWQTGLSFGLLYGQWPFIPTGSLTEIEVANRYGGFAQRAPIITPVVAFGDHWDAGLFTTAAFSAGGVRLTTAEIASGGAPNGNGIITGGTTNGSGALVLGNASISQTTQGLVITSKGFIGSGAPTITNGGGGGTNQPNGNFFNYEMVQGSESTLATGCFNGTYQVATTSPTLGSILSLSPAVQPTCPGTVAPNGAVVVTGGSGLSATITPNWVANDNIFIGSQYGDVIMGSTSAIVAAATTGFLDMPFSTAAPTGVPALASVNCEVNTTSGSINCYFGGAWHHLTMSAGAN